MGCFYAEAKGAGTEVMSAAARTLMSVIPEVMGVE